MTEELVPKPSEKPGLSAEDESRLVEEMRQMEYEPLLPVEKKLITYSIGLGIILLFFFVWLSQTYFTGQ